MIKHRPLSGIVIQYWSLTIESVMWQKLTLMVDMDAHRLIYIPFYGVNVAFDTFYTLWRAISRSNSRSRRTLIHAQRASACICVDKSAISCLVVPRVEAVLEDSCLDVVSSLALLKWN